MDKYIIVEVEGRDVRQHFRYLVVGKWVLIRIGRIRTSGGGGGEGEGMINLMA